MKKRIVFLSLMVVLISIYSCKKEKNIPEPYTPVSYPNYSQLKVGNYWIYQQYDIDSLGNVTPTTKYDSCYVEKDTSINGKIYYKMFREYPIPENNYSFLKDSLHYIVNNKGDILFSSQDFSTLFKSGYQVFGNNNSDTVCKYTTKMEDKDMGCNVPAGIYATSNFKTTYLMYPKYGNRLRYKNIRYTESIGIVSEILPFFVGSPDYIERRLVRYHLAP